MKSEFWVAECDDAFDYVEYTPEEAAWGAWERAMENGCEPADVTVRGYVRAQATDQDIESLTRRAVSAVLCALGDHPRLGLPENGPGSVSVPHRTVAESMVRKILEAWPGGVLEPTGETNTYSAEYFREEER